MWREVVGTSREHETKVPSRDNKEKVQIAHILRLFSGRVSEKFHQPSQFYLLLGNILECVVYTTSLRVSVIQQRKIPLLHKWHVVPMLLLTFLKRAEHPQVREFTLAERERKTSIFVGLWAQAWDSWTDWRGQWQRGMQNSLEVQRSVQLLTQHKRQWSFVDSRSKK